MDKNGFDNKVESSIFGKKHHYINTFRICTKIFVILILLNYLLIISCDVISGSDGTVNNSASYCKQDDNRIISTESNNNSFYPSVAVDSTWIHVVWADASDHPDGKNGTWDIFYKKKLINGNWPNVTEVVSTESWAGASRPVIVSDNVNLYVAWQDYSNYHSAGADADIFFKMKPINSEWPKATEVVSTESTGNSFDPHLAVDSNHIYITWHDFTDHNGCGTDIDVFFKRKLIYDVWPTATEVVSTESDSDSSYPSIAVDANRVYIAWGDISNYNGTGNDKDVFLKSKLLDKNWPNITQVVTAESDDNISSQEIAVDGNYIYVIWSDFSNIYGSGSDVDIYYKKKLLNDVWENNAEIVSSDSDVHSVRPRMQVFNNIIYATWQENAILNAGFFDFYRGEIRFSNKVLDGIWPSSTMVVYRDDIYGALNPSIAVDLNENAHITWYRRKRSDPNDCSDIMYTSVTPF